MFKYLYASDLDVMLINLASCIPMNVTFNSLNLLKSLGVV